MELRLGLADELADGRAVEAGDLGQHIEIRQALAPLPFGYGLVGIAELLPQRGLGIAVGLAVAGDIFPHQGPQVGLLQFHGNHLQIR